MPRFAANLTMLFNEAPFLERFERAAAAGFKAVEFLFAFLDKIGYPGWIRCEYKPAGTPEAGPGWAHAYLKQYGTQT